MNVYILSFNDTVSKENAIKQINLIPEIVDWHTSITNTIFIVSALSHEEVFGKLDSGVFNNQRYALSRFGVFRARLPEDTWAFLRKHISVQLDKELEK